MRARLANLFRALARRLDPSDEVPVEYHVHFSEAAGASIEEQVRKAFAAVHARRIR